MPTLHRYTNQPGYFVRGVANGKPVAFRLTGEGEQYLLETLGLAEGAKFSGDTLKWLYRKQWAANLDSPPEPAPEPAASSESPPSGPEFGDHNPVVFQGVVRIQLSAVDHVLLDQSADEVVRTLRRSGAVVFGPLPMPVHVETYVVVRDGTRHPYPIRQYQRLFQVRQARRRTIESMNEFRLPREVDVRVEMK
jgi:small subunit ribosomal protein S10